MSSLLEHLAARFRNPDSGFLLGLGAATATLAAMTAYFSFGDGGSWSGFPLDDAWIHRVYARSFAFGHGFQYNVGADEAGATSPLWVIVTAPAEWLSVLSFEAVVIAVKVLGALCAAAFVAGVFAVSRDLLPERREIAALPAILVAADPRLAFSLLSGMESALVAALWIWAVRFAQTRRWTLFAASAALLPTARPEAALFLPVAWALLLFAKDLRPKRKAILLAITALPSAFWIAFCLHATGRPLPTTFYVKAAATSDVASALENAALAIASSGFSKTFAFLLGLVGFAAILWKRRKSAATVGLLLGALPLAYALGVAFSRQVRLDGHYWTRWFDPPAFALSAASALGLAHLALFAFSALRRFLAAKIAAAFFALVLALSAFALAESARSSKALLVSNIADIERINVAAGKWIARNVPKNLVVGAHDAGAVKYFGERPTLDFGGLNYHELAFDWSLASRSLEQSSWLAVFPKRLERTNALDVFVKMASFSVPKKEYSICDCPTQTELGVYARRGIGRTGISAAP